MSDGEPYWRRVVDDELSELISELAAVAIEGPKGVGKTRTALRYARTIRRLDDPAKFAVAQAAPERLSPTRTSQSFRSRPNSGAGRIVSVEMRPLSLAERLGEHTVSLRELLAGGRGAITGTTEGTVEEYATEVLASGFPGMRRPPSRARRAQLDGYIERVVDRDIPDDAGVTIRNPAALRRWMVACAAASSSTASFEKIRDAASGGQDGKPSKETTQNYRDALTRVWVLDEVPAWLPSGGPPARACPGTRGSARRPRACRRIARCLTRDPPRRPRPTHSRRGAGPHAAWRPVREPRAAFATCLRTGQRGTHRAFPHGPGTARSRSHRRGPRRRRRRLRGQARPHRD